MAAQHNEVVRYTIHARMDQSSLRPSTSFHDSISSPPFSPIEINLPAFYNAIATRSDGG